jgi:hypothetical protein
MKTLAFLMLNGPLKTETNGKRGSCQKEYLLQSCRFKNKHELQKQLLIMH